MEKRKMIFLIGIGIVVLLGLGGKCYMDREKDKQELVMIQKDLANYLYNNYVLYTVDQEKDAQLDKEYNGGNGNLTTEEFLDKSKALNEYVDIEKIEFTDFSVTPMNYVKAHFTINGVYKESVLLDTISAETNKLIYRITSGTGDGPYYIEEKEEKTNKPMPEDEIIYY